MNEGEQQQLQAITQRTMQEVMNLVEGSQIRVNQERAELHRQQENLRREIAEFNRMKLVVDRHNERMQGGVIKLNVGGKLFQALRTTLCSEPNSLFGPLLSDNFLVERDEEGNIFIDRDPETFPFILDYLRRYAEAGSSKAQQAKALENVLVQPRPATSSLLADAEYFGISSLIHSIEKATFNAWVNGRISFSKEHQLKVHTDFVLCCLPWDNDRIFFGSADHCITECYGKTLACRHNVKGHDDYVTSIIRYDDHHFLTTSRDGTAKLWLVPMVQNGDGAFEYNKSSSSGNTPAAGPSPPEQGEPSSSPSRRKSSTMGNGGKGPNTQPVPILTLSGHGEFVYDACIVSVVADQNGGGGTTTTVATSGQDSNIRLWTLTTEMTDRAQAMRIMSRDSNASLVETKCTGTYRCHAPAKTIVAYDGYIYAACQDNVEVIDPINLVKITELVGHTGVIRCITPCAARNCIITGSWDHTCRVWPLSTTTGTDTPPQFYPGISVAGHDSWVSSVGVYGDLLVSSAGRCIYFFDLYSLSMKGRIELEHEDVIRCFCITGEVGKESYLYTGSFDKTVKMTVAHQEYAK